jgi:hypothetical protein
VPVTLAAKIVALLVRIYQDTPGFAAGTYTGRRIRVRFEAGQLKAADGGLGWFTGFDRTPPVILFRATGENGSFEAALRWALLTLFLQLGSREFTREDGTPMRIGHMFVDAGDGDVAEIIYDAVRQSPFASMITPSIGIGIGVKKKPMAEYEPRPGELQGYHWRLGPVPGRQRVQRLLIDTNHWKSFVHKRLATALGDPGGLTLWGSKPELHKMISEHLTAERRTKVEAPEYGRWLYEWDAKVGKPDNHLFDIVTGCAAAASKLGLIAPGELVVPTQQPWEWPTAAELKAGKRG